ncbi:MAG TPA: endonuclease/exonuclease/phosphatase family protein [Mycobacteriales bacterium]|nr:endonuclease/exonuclease/phosphatase family protein [Mycobacteriales bacterium]
MRLLSMNIWGTHGDWDARRELLAGLFAQHDPDVVTLQETIVRDGHDQVRDLLAGRNVVHSGTRAADGSGITTASRWPIIAAHELELPCGPRNADFPATTLITEIDAPGGPLLLVNHFPSWKLQLEAERCDQTLAAARAIEDLCPDLQAPVVVAGDFDADPDSTSIRFWTGRHPLEGHSVCYRDAWDAVQPGSPGHTFTPENPLLADEDWPFGRIDYVMVRCAVHGGAAMRIRDCRIIGDDPPASDHYGLLADLERR